MSIVIRMASGLANRMFQYTYYLYLKKMGVDVYIDNSYRPSFGHKDCAHEILDWNRIFPKASYRQASKSTLFRMGGGYDLFSKIRRRFLHFTTCSHHVENPFGYLEVNELRNNMYLIGIFQNAQMADKVKNEVASFFSFSPMVDEKNTSLTREIQTSESVAIHIRKGKDYMSRDEYKGTCEKDYYDRAINHIKERVDNPKFYVFTDNPIWVKENLTSCEYTLVNWNPIVGWGNHFDMQLQSHCKHNIIANSTYSWWGAFLNKNPDKIVIGPACWFNKNLKQYAQLQNETLCKDWIAL